MAEGAEILAHAQVGGLGLWAAGAFIALVGAIAESGEATPPSSCSASVTEPGSSTAIGVLALEKPALDAWFEACTAQQ